MSYGHVNYPFFLWSDSFVFCSPLLLDAHSPAVDAASELAASLSEAHETGDSLGASEPTVISIVTKIDNSPSGY